MYECNDCGEIFEDPEFYDIGLVEWKGCPNCKSEDYSVIQGDLCLLGDKCPHEKTGWEDDR